MTSSRAARRAGYQPASSPLRTAAPTLKGNEIDHIPEWLVSFGVALRLLRLLGALLRLPLDGLRGGFRGAAADRRANQDQSNHDGFHFRTS